jgi:hypothetical protein
MKLALEIALALTLANLVVLACAMAIGVERELRLVDRDLRRDHVLLGTELASAVTSVWKAAGPEEALALLEADRSNDHVAARWRWLDETAAGKPRVTPGQATQLRNGETVSLTFPNDGGTITFCRRQNS